MNCAASVCTRKPTAKPTTAISATTNTLRARSAKVRPVSTAELAIGRARKRSSRPLFTSVARPMAVLVAPKTAVCTKIPGHEEVDVADASRDADRAAEHVAEQQHEDDRLDQGEHEQRRHAPVGDEVAPRDGEAVARRPGEAMAAHRDRAVGDGHVLMRPPFRLRPRSLSRCSSDRSLSPAGCAVAPLVVLAVVAVLAGEGEEGVVEGRLADRQASPAPAPRRRGRAAPP